MPFKQCFFDVETTGLNHNNHGIIQLAGILEIDGAEKERFNYKIQPFPQDVIDENALKVNGITEDEMLMFPDPMTVYLEFTAMLSKYVDKFDKSDKIQLVGYNARFDDDFLRSWFKKCGDKYYGSYFSWPSVDITNLIARVYRKSRHKFPSFKLTSVAAIMGIPVDESQAHDAMYDVLLTKAIDDKLETIINPKERVNG